MRVCAEGFALLCLYTIAQSVNCLIKECFLDHSLVCDEPFYEVISVSLHMSVITQDGNSALINAASNGSSTEVASLLLKAGANIHLQNKVCQ